MVYWKLFDEVHLRSGLFCRLIKWNVEDISCKENSSGFIVQHVTKIDTKILPDCDTRIHDYWEAWMVVDGIVYITKARLDFKTKRYIFEDAPPSSNDDFDDQWSNDIDENLTIESSMDLYKVLSEDHILRSYGKKIGIKGSISMTADVYWVGKEQEEFDKINSWGELSFIPAAGALRSCNDAKFMHDKLKAGSQEPLLHNYNLSTKELCICALGADLAEYARIPFSSKQIKKVFDQNNWCERFIDN